MRTIASINQSITCARVVIVYTWCVQAITSALAGASDRRKDVEVLQAKLVDIEKSTLGRKAEVEEEVGGALGRWGFLLPCWCLFWSTAWGVCL